MSNRADAGYTLVEILVAMAILIFGVVAIMRMLPIALREAHLAGEQTVAAAHADSQLGVIRQRGAEDTMLLTRDVDRYIQVPATANVLYTGAFYNLQRMDGPSHTYLQRVTYTIQMPNERRQSFVTYIARQ